MIIDVFDRNVDVQILLRPAFAAGRDAERETLDHLAPTVHEIDVCGRGTVHADNLFALAVKLQYRYYAPGLVVSCLALFDSELIADRGSTGSRCSINTSHFLGGC